MKISIFGLGYVGTVSLACLTRDGHEVIGVDIDQAKLDLIKSGNSPIVEGGMQDLVASAVSGGHVQVTSDVAMAIGQSEISFVCVGTPSLAGGGQDQAALSRLMEAVGTALTVKDSFHAVVIRSTVTPGTVKNVIIPLLEDNSGKSAESDFGVCFQPEFLREGTSIQDYDNPPYTVIGSESERAIALARTLYEDLSCEFIETSIESAEVLKYCCNSFHALKATFANEIGRLCQSLDVDSLEVMRMVCRDTHLNISSAYLKPGFSFGGSCLPKDLRALTKLSQTNDVQLPMLDSVLSSNALHLQHSLDLMHATGKRRVGLIGLSFKSGTDDLRESPLVALAEGLIGKGYALQIYDPEVNLSRIIGGNKAYIDQVIPHISSLMCGELDAVVRGAEIVVLGLSDNYIKSEVVDTMSSEQLLFDLTSSPDLEKDVANYMGVCW